MYKENQIDATYFYRDRRNLLPLESDKEVCIITVILLFKVLLFYYLCFIFLNKFSKMQ